MQELWIHSKGFTFPLSFSHFFSHSFSFSFPLSFPTSPGRLPGEGEASSLLSWMGGRRKIGSLRRGGLQAGESDPAAPE